MIRPPHGCETRRRSGSRWWEMEAECLCVHGERRGNEGGVGLKAETTVLDSRAQPLKVFFILIYKLNNINLFTHGS